MRELYKKHYKICLLLLLGIILPRIFVTKSVSFLLFAVPKIYHVISLHVSCVEPYGLCLCVSFFCRVKIIHALLGIGYFFIGKILGK